MKRLASREVEVTAVVTCKKPFSSANEVAASGVVGRGATIRFTLSPDADLEAT